MEKQIEETHVSRAGWTKVNGHSTKTFCQNIKAAATVRKVDHWICHSSPKKINKTKQNRTVLWQQ